ncbi:hypothetical protein M409DRAFT_25219 [Zasmidium cellare ATCC 36951]|uniref:Peptidase S53 domain-containing protein n=1 Tax=Zasmidium cellare ATCC 36951 TaxID=1080233 RepID=A0A6A6CDP5_ZASCE|nr:uncharacterized protein M409DRAFT_25219 [Zasmidium cellare ATCC 36951]KAF2164340.1 hypothetical protein M409DRAFT_25219 [Zasmidium cellare ATCC 36951]
MSFYARLAVPLLFALPTFAAPTLPPDLGPLTLFDELKALPSEWTKASGNASESKLNVKIGLKQSNIQGLEQRLLEVATPGNADYGNWLSKEEIDSYVAPSAVNVALVKTWLALYGITDVTSPTSDWLAFSAPVSTMEALLGTQYDFYTHPSRKGAIPRTTQYSVPLLLHDVIDLVTPTTAFYRNLAPQKSVAAPESKRRTKRQSCTGTTITPKCLYQLYNVTYTSKGSQTVATTELIEVGAVHSDYASFAKQFSISSTLADFTDVSVSGGSNPGTSADEGTLEGNLDTQYMGAIARTFVKNQFLALGPSGESDQDFEDELANLASYLTSTSSPPSVVSTSYGGEEQAFSSSYMTRVCNEFMKAGSAGISVFFSSGDGGVGGNGEPSCNNGFYPVWPAVCPYSTAVGGTMFSSGKEVVANAQTSSGTFTPGGGFSNTFSTPSYQSSQVSKYITYLNGKYNGLYNAKGRGFPDISLASVNYQIVDGGSVEGVLGTSASSPTWAALVSLLNDYRHSQGKATLGFLNPLLYSATTGLNDITSGSNSGCNSKGFSATTGWDPASGLGSINFGKFLSNV